MMSQLPSSGNEVGAGCTSSPITLKDEASKVANGPEIMIADQKQHSK